jgi:hypothetical protein
MLHVWLFLGCSADMFSLSLMSKFILFVLILRIAPASHARRHYVIDFLSALYLTKDRVYNCTLRCAACMPLAMRSQLSRSCTDCHLVGRILRRCRWCSIRLLAAIPGLDSAIQNVCSYLSLDSSGVDKTCRYIQMSAMIFGGMIEADARMVRYHQAVRSHKKLQSDIAVWRAYENEYEERGTPAVASESKAQGKNDG